MSLDVRIGTCNIGVPFTDYQSMLRTKNPEAAQALNQRLDAKTQSEEFQTLARSLGGLEAAQARAVRAQLVNLQTKYENELGDEIDQPIAAKLANELDVICLQEVKNVNRAFIRTLQTAGFEIVTPVGETIDTAIAVRRSIYSAHTPFSTLTVSERRGDPFGEDVAGTTITLRNGVTIAVASLHTPGFALYRPGSAPRQVRDQSGEKNVADNYVAKVFDHLANQQADIKIVAGDMNNNPQNHTTPFSRIQQRGFTVMQPKQATDWNGADQDYSARVLDFIFLRQKPFFESWKLFFKSLVSPVLRVSATAADVMKGYAFESGKTCSDHLPVATVLHIETRSLLQRIGQFARRLVGV